MFVDSMGIDLEIAQEIERLLVPLVADHYGQYAEEVDEHEKHNPVLAPLHESLLLGRA